MAEKSSLGTANKRKKLGFVWRNIKKISQITNAYLYLPFFFLIILWPVSSFFNRQATYRGRALVWPCIFYDGFRLRSGHFATVRQLPAGWKTSRFILQAIENGRNEEITRYLLIELPCFQPKPFLNCRNHSGRPSSVNLCKKFLNLSHETVPLIGKEEWE